MRKNEAAKSCKHVIDVNYYCFMNRLFNVPCLVLHRSFTGYYIFSSLIVLHYLHVERSARPQLLDQNRLIYIPIDCCHLTCKTNNVGENAENCHVMRKAVIVSGTEILLHTEMCTKI